jgi:hypothetical protein
MIKKKTSALAKLRILIREEVKNAIREEMPILIMEALAKQNRLLESAQKKGLKTIQEIPEKEIKKPKIPGTLNTRPFNPAKQFQQAVPLRGGDPVSQLLQETAAGMLEEDTLAFTTAEESADPMSFMQNIEAPVGSVQDMLATSRPSSAVEMVQVNAVPDFTDLMQKMIKKGVI